MKQLLILSGKGGTGKTTIASAFITLSKAKAFADCDVDAPNLHLVKSQAGNAKRSDYYGLPKAYLDTDIGATGSAEAAANSYLQGELHSTGSVCHEHHHHDGCGEH